jgi:hypothetical protein
LHVEERMDDLVRCIIPALFETGRQIENLALPAGESPPHQFGQYIKGIPVAGLVGTIAKNMDSTGVNPLKAVFSSLSTLRLCLELPTVGVDEVEMHLLGRLFNVCRISHDCTYSSTTKEEPSEARTSFS